MGPVGSSKSSACCVEMLTRSMEQAPSNGVRRTRWAAVRNTFGELETTTIQTFRDWFPFAKIVSGSPITATIELPLPDRTRVVAEFWFFPLDRPEDIRKLRSLEITGGWLNEASEMPKAAFDMLTQRVGRFPSAKNGGPSWSGVIMDYNPPDDDSWLYKLAERDMDQDALNALVQTESKLRGLGMLGENQPFMEFFKQPGGLIERDGQYEENPLAENIRALPGGHAYYWRQVPGKNKEWIKVFLLGQYGSVQSGKPVYPEWNDELHCRPVQAYPKKPLLLGFDYGLSPACAICQVTPEGRFLVLDEVVGFDMAIREFAETILKPHLAMNFPGFGYLSVGDPSGMSRKDTDERTAAGELMEAGFPVAPAFSNQPIARRDAVAKYLGKLIGGKPVMMVDPKCRYLRKGFNGGYQYKRVQVVGYEKYKDVPEKNEFSHIHDALQYAALYSQTVNLNGDFDKPIKYPNMGVV